MQISPIVGSGLKREKSITMHNPMHTTRDSFANAPRNHLTSTISPDIGSLMNNLDGPGMLGGFNSSTFNNDKAFDIPTLNNGAPTLNRNTSINAPSNNWATGLPGSINNETFSWKPMNSLKSDIPGQDVPGLKTMTSIDPFINT
jgi:hypothetical protein